MILWSYGVYHLYIIQFSNGCSLVSDHISYSIQEQIRNACPFRMSPDPQNPNKSKLTRNTRKLAFCASWSTVQMLIFWHLFGVQERMWSISRENINLDFPLIFPTVSLFDYTESDSYQVACFSGLYRRVTHVCVCKQSKHVLLFQSHFLKNIRFCMVPSEMSNLRERNISHTSNFFS